METGITVVRVRDVSKRFVIRKEKSLKERIVNARPIQQAQGGLLGAARRRPGDRLGHPRSGSSDRTARARARCCKLIGGIMQPTRGTVERRGRLAALLELGAGFHPDLTGRENVYLNASILGLSRAQTEKHFDAIVDFSGIEKFIDTQVKFYSSGMYVRLAFAVAVHVDPDVLLVDEVLAVGDEPFQRKCMDRIRSFQHEGRTIILVSHSLDQVAELCDRAVVLENGQVRADGDPREALRHLRADFEAARQQERAREQQYESTPRSPRARVTAVSIEDAAGGRVTAIKPGADLVVGVDIDSDEELTNWSFGVGIDTPLGQAVYATNTALMKVPMPNIKGHRRFRLRLPALWLGEGNYAVHAFIAQESGVEIDRLADAATFTVEGDGRGIGYLHTTPEVLAD